VELPKYNDDDALAKWLAEIIADADDEAAAREFSEESMRDHPPLRVTVTTELIERAAIEAADRGNFKALADMIEKGNDLSPKAMAMIAAKLKGTFKPSKLGRPKQPIWKRDLNPMHDAAKEVDKITVILKRRYPKETGHTDRAIDIAAKLSKVNRQKLYSHYNKSPHRRRRPT
jgi:hypothetical protein